MKDLYLTRNTVETNCYSLCLTPEKLSKLNAFLQEELKHAYLFSDFHLRELTEEEISILFTPALIPYWDKFFTQEQIDYFNTDFGGEGDDVDRLWYKIYRNICAYMVKQGGWREGDSQEFNNTSVISIIGVAAASINK